MIDVERGDVAPLYVDFDGGGVRDLLLGTFTPGDLRVYNNRGSDKAPVFTDFELLVAGGSPATVPTS